MNQNLDLTPLSALLNASQSILIVLPTKVDLDKIAASLGFYLALKKNNKKAAVVCSQSMTVQFSQLVGVDKITNKLGQRDLVVSFDYRKDSIEKVSYNIEDDKFHLVIQPKAGFPAPDQKTVTYSSSGTDADLILVVGSQELEDLGEVYQQNKSFYQSAPVVNIDRQADNRQFGKVNLVFPQAASYSELAALILRKLRLEIDEDIATNLYSGLQAATSNFQDNKVTADTFEAAAWCLRHGARRAGQLVAQPVDEKEKNQSLSEDDQSLVEEASAPLPDWLSPKIYRSNTRV